MFSNEEIIKSHKMDFYVTFIYCPKHVQILVLLIFLVYSVATTLDWAKISTIMRECCVCVYIKTMMCKVAQILEDFQFNLK